MTEQNNYRAKEIANKIELFMMKNKKLVLFWTFVFIILVSFALYKILFWISKDDLESRYVDIEFQITQKDSIWLFQWATVVEEWKAWQKWVKQEFFDKETWKVYFTEYDCEKCKEPKNETQLRWKYSVEEWELAAKTLVNNFFYLMKQRKYEQAIALTDFVSQNNVWEREILNLEKKANFKMNDFFLTKAVANLKESKQLTVDVYVETSYELDWLWPQKEIMKLPVVFNTKNNKWEFTYPFFYEVKDLEWMRIWWLWETSATLTSDRLTINMWFLKLYKKLWWWSLLKVWTFSSVWIEELSYDVILWVHRIATREDWENKLWSWSLSLKLFWWKMQDNMNSKQELVRKEQRTFYRDIFIERDKYNTITDSKVERAKYLKFVFSPKTVWSNLPKLDIIVPNFRFLEER